MGKNGPVVVRVDVNGDVLRWARERSGVDELALAKKFPKLAEWEAGDRSPTLRQLEGYAQTTHTPVGFLLLDEAPSIEVPIPRS